MIDDAQQFWFSIVRYVPNVVKGEYVNIGIVLLGPGDPPAVRVRFTSKWERVQCWHKQADVRLLRAFRHELCLRLESSDPRAALQELQKPSAMLQCTPLQACRGKSLAQELETLCRLYL